MLISRTPFRISFFGGGTDYPQWFRDHPGAVLSTTVNRYCYLSVRRLPPFFPHKTRASWSKIELVGSNADITHPAIRGCLEYMAMEDGLEIHHDGDLPGRSGMGSSAAFTVGLLHALHGLKSEMVSKRQLAVEAMEVDQDLANDVVGCQDHIASAFGGLNRIDFNGDRGAFTVTPMPVDKARLRLFRDHLMLFYTGLQRTASSVAARQVASFPEKEAELRRIYEMVGEGQKLLSDGRFREFGLLLHEAWLAKRSLGASNERVDGMYGVALKSGALGGKLLGAGDGGFMLIFAEPDRRREVRDALYDLLYVPFEFEGQGSQIIYYAQE